MLRLLSWNIRYGGVGREEALAAVIRRCAPDVVVLQEATRPEVVRRLSELTALPTFGSRRGRSVAFLSRLPIAQPVWRRPLLARRGFLDLTIAEAGIRLFGVHLTAVHAAWTERRRLLELQAVLAAVRSTSPTPHVLLGDFNTLAPDERLDVDRLPARLRALVWLSGGSIKWRTIAHLLEAGYTDAWRFRHPEGARAATFPTWDPHLRLDFAFVPSGERHRVRRCEVIDDAAAAAASDHFPLLIELDSASAAPPGGDAR
jgi:endonuclease/exonuclease/phosphatase family metal-dependent hydrolase